MNQFRCKREFSCSIKQMTRLELTSIRGSSGRGSSNGSGGGLDGRSVTIDDDGSCGGKSSLNGGIVLHCYRSSRNG